MKVNLNELNCTNPSPFICYFLPDDRARELMTCEREKVVNWSKSDFELFRDLLWCTVSFNLDSADKTENISHWHSKNERNEFTFSGWSRDLSLTRPPLCPARPFSTNFHVIKRRHPPDDVQIDKWMPNFSHRRHRLQGSAYLNCIQIKKTNENK